MKTFLLSLLVSTSMAFGGDRLFVPDVKASKILFEIPYTAGVHKGEAIDVQGKLLLDGANNKLLSGRFIVPIAAMKTNNATRDCHMREALGIDYTNSLFPGQHVCDNKNETPPSGPNSIAFPNIEFEFTELLQGSEQLVEIQGRFTIHGKTVLAKMGGTLTQEGEKIRLQLTFPVKLADFGIIVKPSQLGPVVVKVGEAATVKLNLKLVPSQD